MILVLASGNRGKLEEYRALLGGLPIALRPLAAIPGAPTVAEDAPTYLGNARAKAHALARHSGLAALADDSGLEVDALGGAPGVRSARFAADAGRGSGDAANVALLLERLRDTPAARRTARFCCVVVVAFPDGGELVAEGSCVGTIPVAPRGGGGFGYDPVFYFPPRDRTFAELDPAEKNRVSHRAQAVAALLERLRPAPR